MATEEDLKAQGRWDYANNCPMTTIQQGRQTLTAADYNPDNPPPGNGVSASGIHPAPDRFSPEQLAVDPILRFFHYAHLPPKLQVASQPFCDLAQHIIMTLPRNAERTVALRKLLEAKDAAVRANLG